ncbi:hypothetical protein X975_18173, partial [Stegodyphus mimosarum]
MHRSARERVSLATEKMKTRYDTRATNHRFNEGDKVWLWNPTRHKGLCPKLQSPWNGLYTVLNRLNDFVDRIQEEMDSTAPRLSVKIIVDSERLARYFTVYQIAEACAV